MYVHLKKKIKKLFSFSHTHTHTHTKYNAIQFFGHVHVHNLLDMVIMI